MPVTCDKIFLKVSGVDENAMQIRAVTEEQVYAWKDTFYALSEERIKTLAFVKCSERVDSASLKGD